MWIKQTAAVAGQAVKVCTFKFHTKVRFLVMGPGIIRWGTNKEQLERQEVVGFDNGLPQTNANGEIEREWTGELWVVASVAGSTVQVVAPEYEFYSQRGLPPLR